MTKYFSLSFKNFLDIPLISNYSGFHFSFCGFKIGNSDLKSQFDL